MKQLGIQKKVAVSFLVATLCVILGGWIVFSSLTATILLRWEKQNLESVAHQLSLDFQMKLDRQMEIARTCTLLEGIREQIRRQNESYAGMNQEQITQQIRAIDLQWEEEGPEARKAMETALLGPASARLRSILDFEKEKLAEIFVTDKRGAVVASTNKTTDYDQSDEIWWQEAFNLGRGQPSIGEIEYDESSRAYALAIAMPVLEKSEVLGVLKMVVRAQGLFNFLSRVHLGETGEAFFCDSAGKILFARAHTYLEPEAASLEMRYAEGLLGSFSNGLGKKSVVAAFAPIPPLIKIPGAAQTRRTPGILVFKTTQEILTPFFWISSAFLATGLAFYLILIWVGMWLSRKKLASISSLGQAAQRVLEGREVGPLEIRTGDELENISRALTQSAEKSAEAKIKLDRALTDHEKVMDAIADAVLVVDFDGLIHKVNAAASQLLGYSSVELEGKSLSKILFDPAEYELNDFILNRLRHEKTVSHSVLTLRDSVGEPVTVSCEGSTYLCEETGKLCVVVIARSVPELEQAMRELKGSQTEWGPGALPVDPKTLAEQLENAQKMQLLSDVLRGFLHDLNNPLTTVIGFSELLQEAPSSPKVPDYLKKIWSEAKRCRQIVEEIQAMVRAPTGARQWADLNELVQRVAALRSYLWRKQNIEVEMELASDLPSCYLDVPRVQESLMIWLANAEEALQNATAAEQKRPRKIKIKTEPHGRALRLTVEDTGCGISSENVRKLGTPFYTTKPGRLGLGLKYVAATLRELGGTWKVDSREGVGSKFEMEIPIGAEKAGLARESPDQAEKKAS